MLKSVGNFRFGKSKITEADNQMMEKFGNPYLKHMPRFKRLRPLKERTMNQVRHMQLDIMI